MNKLTPDAVTGLLAKCMFHDSEVGPDKTRLPGVPDPVRGATPHLDLGFHPTRLEQHRPEVIDLLRQLHREFLSPGGYPFVFLGLNAAGEQWGSITYGEALAALAVALGVGRFSDGAFVVPGLGGPPVQDFEFIDGGSA